jgi:hypothetical protein
MWHCGWAAQSLTVSSMERSKLLIRKLTSLCHACGRLKAIDTLTFVQSTKKSERILRQNLRQHDRKMVSDCFLSNKNMFSVWNSFDRKLELFQEQNSCWAHLLCLPCSERDWRVDTFCDWSFFKQENLSNESYETHCASKHSNREWGPLCRERNAIDAKLEHDQISASGLFHPSFTCLCVGTDKTCSYPPCTGQVS